MKAVKYDGTTPRAAFALSLLAMCALVGTMEAKADPYVVTLQEVGSNVVATGSGEFNLTGLTSDGLWTAGAADMDGSAAHISTGLGGALDGYIGFTGPKSFGSGGNTSATSTTGSRAEIINDPGVLQVFWVPAGYVSGTALSDTATYDGATFASLGVTPGIYTWTWGSAADQSFRWT